MKRKLFLGLAALAALTVTSCQKDLVINQLPDEQPIEFGTYVGRDAQTKASETDLTAMQNANYPGFGVYAYYTDGSYVASTTTETVDDDETTTYASPANFMSNQKVQYESSSWGYTPLKYWPALGGTDTKQLKFIAYAPYYDGTTATENIKSVSSYTTTGTGESAVATPHAGDPMLSFTVADKVEKQIDLLYASSEAITTKPNDNTVELNFKHALSRIGFAAAADNTNNKITINSITLEGKFNTSGTMNMNGGEFPSVTSAKTTYSVSFTNSSNKSVEGTTSNAIIPDENYIMIIPKVFGNPTGYTGTINTDKITITVNYDIEVKDNNLATGYAPRITQEKVGYIQDINFEKGKAYKISMVISPQDPIIFKASVTNWDENTPPISVSIPSTNN